MKRFSNFSRIVLISSMRDFSCLHLADIFHQKILKLLAEQYRNRYMIFDVIQILSCATTI